MGFNFVLIILGLIICFGGIYFRRICSGILGLVWGVIGAFIIALLTVGLWHIDDSETITAILLSGVILAIISAIHYRVCVAINGFMSSAIIVLFLLMMADEMDSTSAIIIAAIVGLICAVITYKFYDYSYILITALSGAFTASVGFWGVMKGYDMEDVLMEIMWSGFKDFSPVMLGTIALGIVGFFVQLHRLKSNDTTDKSEPGDII